MTTLAPTLEAFFAQRLVAQRRCSPHTVAAYRDTFRLLLGFAQRITGISPAKLELETLDAPLIGAFLDHLEADRGVGIATRNARLSAIHSFFAFAALRHPEYAGLIQRVLAIPAKRADRGPISYLTRAEIDALLGAPDRTTRLGRRDHALLLLAVDTGLRVSELCGLRRSDVTLGAGAAVTCTGKGRKQRSTPLTAGASGALAGWIKGTAGGPADPLFPGPRGHQLTRDAIRRMVERHVATAVSACPSLATKRVAPHVLRHSCAMQLLEAGVDVAVIALWLGHESIRTTDIYQHADLAMKERALARLAPRPSARGRYRPPDTLLAFLESL
ncbi:MAG TPA: tyrosine-type recombinase/integrase [Acidimicrobiales bacterium]|nr:tyrosine-type recombinase/integrase [Acidimicrobiales bacterium]